VNAQSPLLKPGARIATVHDFCHEHDTLEASEAMKITFRQIDAFRTVMLSGTVTLAAKMLGISQPAVSRLILDFEEQLGFQLFLRSGRRLVPTEEAKLLADEVHRALSGLERIKDTATAIASFRHARISFISNPNFSSVILPDLIKRFAVLRPETAVVVEVQASEDAVEWMTRQNFDFGIIPGQLEAPLMNEMPLIDRPSVCIVPEDHPLAEHDEIVPKDLEDVSFISYRSGTSFRFVIDQTFEKYGVSRVMQYEARTTDAICRLVAAGLGISIIGTVQTPTQYLRGCNAIPFKPAIPFSAKLIWSETRSLSAVGELFLDMVKEHGI
jgi:DNA-binding transcriptional LysR family regulator